MLVSQEATMTPRYHCSIQRLSAAFLLLALLLPLLAACGGAPTAAQDPALVAPPSIEPVHNDVGVVAQPTPAPAFAARPTPAPAATMAPVSSGAGAPSQERMESA